MSDFTVLHNKGDPISANEPMYVYLYPNTSSEDSEVGPYIADRLDTALDEFYSSGAIDYYEINVTYRHPTLVDSSKGLFLDEFDWWLSNTQTNHGGISLTTAEHTSGSPAGSMEG